MNIDIILDLETLDTAPTASIIEIGAVAIINGKCISEFQRDIIDENGFNSRFTVSESTLKFHIDRGFDFTKRSDAIYIDLACKQFSEWLGGLECQIEQAGEVATTYMWGRGSDFDNAILTHAYSVIGRKQPWSFWNSRCLRTLEAFARSSHKREARHVDELIHTSIGDARFEARMWLKDMNILALQGI